MGAHIQKVRLETEPIIFNILRIKIPKRGAPHPSKEQTDLSIGPNIQRIVIYTSSNYIPGKITFENEEER